MAALAAEDTPSRATASFWWVRRGSRGGSWSGLKAFSECHRKRNHYVSMLKAYSLLRKRLLKNVGHMPKAASQSNRKVIKTLCKDPHLLPLAVAILDMESFQTYPLKSVNSCLQGGRSWVTAQGFSSCGNCR